MKIQYLFEWKAGALQDDPPNIIGLSFRYHYTKTRTKIVGEVIERSENYFSTMWRLYWDVRKKEVIYGKYSFQNTHTQ